MARYAGLILAPAECFGLWPRAFLSFGQKDLNLLFWPISDHFWCLVVTLVSFNSKLSTLKRIQKAKKKKKKRTK